MSSFHEHDKESYCKYSCLNSHISLLITIFFFLMALSIMQLLPGILMLTKLIGREGKLLNVGFDRTLCIYKWPLSFDRKLFSHNKDKALTHCIDFGYTQQQLVPCYCNVGRWIVKLWWMPMKMQTRRGTSLFSTRYQAGVLYWEWFAEKEDAALWLVLDHTRTFQKDRCLRFGWLAICSDSDLFNISHITWTSSYPQVCTSLWSFRSPAPAQKHHNTRGT